MMKNMMPGAKKKGNYLGNYLGITLGIPGYKHESMKNAESSENVANIHWEIQVFFCDKKLDNVCRYVSNHCLFFQDLPKKNGVIVNKSFRNKSHVVSPVRGLTISQPELKEIQVS